MASVLEDPVLFRVEDSREDPVFIRTITSIAVVILLDNFRHLGPDCFVTSNASNLRFTEFISIGNTMAVILQII